MYIPAAFRNDDPATTHGLMDQHSFATLVTPACDGATPAITHLPLLLDRSRGEHGTLLGHFAKANAHWRVAQASAASVAVFQGPHAYISPAWYGGDRPAVPTWNYTAAHAHGPLRLVEDADRAEAIIGQTVDFFEAGQTEPWDNDLPDKVMAGLMQAIVAFEMPIERVESQFKLGQNRTDSERAGAMAHLRATGREADAALADLMESAKPSGSG